MNAFRFLLTGIAVGTATALLFAPKSGKESRAYLKQKASDGVDSAKNQLHHAAETLHSLKEAVAAGVRSGKTAYGEKLAAGNAS